MLLFTLIEQASSSLKDKWFYNYLFELSQCATAGGWILSSPVFLFVSMSNSWLFYLVYILSKSYGSTYRVWRGSSHSVLPPSTKSLLQTHGISSQNSALAKSCIYLFVSLIVSNFLTLTSSYIHIYICICKCIYVCIILSTDISTCHSPTHFPQTCPLLLPLSWPVHFFFITCGLQIVLLAWVWTYKTFPFLIPDPPLYLMTKNSDENCIQSEHPAGLLFFKFPPRELFLLYLMWDFFFWGRVSLCSPSWPGIRRNLPDSALRVLRSRSYNTMSVFLATFNLK